MIDSIFLKALNEIDLTAEEIKYILEIEDRTELEILFNKAYEIKAKYVGKKSYFRGLIELSNYCTKDCYYCGIRKSNTNVSRYLMEEEEIINAAIWAYKNEYGSVVLQSGERNDPQYVEFIEKILKRIKKESDGKLGITLSLGEQSEETYQRWFNAGGHRYLIRIETSNPELYAKLHPADHNFKARKECLHTLKRLGFQVGTGVMIGLPGQTTDNLVNDIFFFRDNDIDMIGMGPFIEHKETPLAGVFGNFEDVKKDQYMLGLKMIAAVRLTLRDVNIASTTALQALNPFGREMGLKAGANIIMPNVTDIKYKESYQLYDGKPCLDENSSLCKDCISTRITGIDETIGLNEWGDSPHFKKRQE